MILRGPSLHPVLQSSVPHVLVENLDFSLSLPLAPEVLEPIQLQQTFTNMYYRDSGIFKGLCDGHPGDS